MSSSLLTQPHLQGADDDDNNGRSELLTKPAEYKVSFKFKDPDSHAPSIAVLDASFQWPTSETKKEKNPLLFQNLRFGVDTHSRVAIVGPNGSGKVGAVTATMT